MHIWWRPHPYSRNLLCPALLQPTLLLPLFAVFAAGPCLFQPRSLSPLRPLSTLPECLDSRPTTLVVTAAHAHQKVKVHIWLQVINLVICAQHPGRRLCSLLHLAPDTLDKGARSRSPTRILGSLRSTLMSTSKSSSASIMLRGLS
jgi:hypothetical protein